MTVLHFDPEGHARVQSLLPWYVNGRLDEPERAVVEAHLARCPRCRADLATERRLHVQLAAAAPTPAAPPPGSRLARVLNALAPAALAPGWRWLIGVQSALLLVLLVVAAAQWLRMREEGGAAYRAMGAVPALAAANVVVMFRADATEAQIRQALSSCGGRFAGGPTTTRAYLLALPAVDAATLERLRSQPGVAMAESLATGDGP